MALIGFLFFVLKVLGLVFLIGLLLNLILDVTIFEPIQKKTIEKQRKEIYDLIIEKMKNGEDITEFAINAAIDESNVDKAINKEK